jgi:hypothetical protein
VQSYDQRKRDPQRDDGGLKTNPIPRYTHDYGREIDGQLQEGCFQRPSCQHTDMVA